jgi:17beta-estradiol 17-dehydrogenase / very-long-chain 3-oxoacyl-CoA reductase
LAAVKPKTFGILSLIGALVIIAKIFKVLKAFYKNVIRPKKNLLKRYGKNSWVLVTGSSDGIGKQFALSFAKRGFNVIISARTKSKL